MTERKVSVVDYGVGNLLSVTRALEAVGATVRRTRDSAEIAASDRIVVPGVGAFGACTDRLRDHGLWDALTVYGTTDRPFLGICVGMQMLLESSEEFGYHAGLAAIPGRVTAIPRTGRDGTPHCIPNIGWRRLRHAEGGRDWAGAILSGLEEGVFVYCVHSFMAVPEDSSHRLADIDYNGRLIAAVIARDNIYGCQFHPEKSGRVGLGILHNFIHL